MCPTIIVVAIPAIQAGNIIQHPMNMQLKNSAYPIPNRINHNDLAIQ